MPDASELKRRANEDFAAKRFAEATQKYRAAIKADGRQPLFWSNLSAALFEQGSYGECQAAVSDALGRFTGDKLPAMPQPQAAKMASRALRSAVWQCDLESAEAWLDHGAFAPHQAGQDENGAAQPTAPLPAAQMQELSAAVDDLRTTLQARGDAPPADAVPSPTIYRPFFSETADAFHTTGQDEPHSMLGGFDEQNEFAAKTGHVPLKITKDNKASVRDGRLDVGVYLGGCGDVRHGYCTMVDVAQRAPALNKVLLRLDLNDHMPEALARFLVCLTILHDVGNLSDGDPAATEERAFFWHVHSSNFLCPQFAAKLRGILERLAAAPQAALPFVHADDDTWAAVGGVLGAWATRAVPVSAALAAMRTRMDTTQAFKDKGATFMNNDMRSAMQDERATAMHDMIMGLSDAQLLSMHGAHGPGAPKQTAAELRAMLTEMVADKDAMSEVVDGSWSHVARMRVADRDYMARRHRLPLPDAVLRAFAGPGGDTKAYEAAEWPVNPALTPLALPCLAEALMEPMHEPLNAFISSELFPKRDLPGPGGLGAPHVSIYDYALPVVKHLAASVRRLADAGALRVGLALGDAFEGLCSADVVYDRMHVSNVPDYTGMLPLLLCAAPRLKRAPTAALSHNILFHCSLWASTEHYNQNSTYLPGNGAIEDLFGLRNSGGQGVFCEIRWVPVGGAPPLDTAALTPARFEAWLQRLVHLLVLPPLNEPKGLPFEHTLPNSLAVLFPLLEHLSTRVPQHWLHNALLPLLAATPATSAVLRPAATLWNAHAGVFKPPTTSWAACDPHFGGGLPVDLTPARDEFHALAALWRPRLPALLRAVRCAPARYTLRLVSALDMAMLKAASPTRGALVAGRAKARSYGVLLQPAEVGRGKGVAATLQAKSAGPEGRAQLVSAIEWDKEAAMQGGLVAVVIKFWLPRDAFVAKARAQWQACLIRTDTWRRMPGCMVALSEAKEC